MGAVAATAVVGTVAACGAPDSGIAPSLAPHPSSVEASTARIDAAACEATPPSGRIVRSGYGLSYSTGTMTIAVKPDGGAPTCVEFAKSGRADPAVPPDTLLFTFAGDRGEGAQLEFLAVDLAGGTLPWPAGAVARPPGAPITTTVGVSLDGVYFASPSCTLALTTVTDQRAAGRFSCPSAVAQTEDPLNPDDDIAHDDPATAATPPKTAALSGLFVVGR
ncbi:hypothetical protein SCNU_12732 [Gordonia neofelifaecis NRRL B-59395]|uniref:Uncharacterized protein n=1 Tax=Gordonia neofelifaecis NRRL B-59395 TaxID=644548 RepID=F1YKW1_9ACTN|nr:hypothetical protein SCNU_12732 [Gordonia neofelifaecis NRRL B-59395]